MIQQVTDDNDHISVDMIIRNDLEVYEGNLTTYFPIVLQAARNWRHGYHNFRHVFHVLWLCHAACRYYATSLTLRQRRNLLVAALFHDFDHIGRSGDDDLNIELAIRGLYKHILPEDAGHVGSIVSLIQITQYPYKPGSEDELSLSAQILRDADSSQALSSAWLQQVLFGLGDEMGVGPITILGRQAQFHRDLRFRTEWAQKRFPQSVIDAKIAEARGLLALLNSD